MQGRARQREPPGAGPGQHTHGTDRAAAGLNRVTAGGEPGSSWTYTRTVAHGAVSAPVALTFAPGSKVWLIVGSAVGITGEKAVLLRNIARC